MRKDKKAKPEVDELSEDMEMIGPGAMLAEARKKLSLSQEEIAQRLNFRLTLVEEIEQDRFDQTLPATFTRGYLCSYAKVVGIDSEDVLASYDALGAANIQRSEMQSFSKETAKQAEHSRLMWISYFIVALLIGLTVMWWLQESRQNPSVPEVIDSTTVTSSADLPTENAQELAKATPVTSPISDSAQPETSTEQADDSVATTKEQAIAAENAQEVNEIAEAAQLTTDNAVITDKGQAESQLDTSSETGVSTAVFTFSGDCWVNIYDATGERVAWGVKKTGYVMTITGQAPFKVTLGKPELAKIVFNEQLVDTSTFNKGNIAKFTLPLTE
ncbi:RodZ domain-containing protein [Litorilituus sediminis]|uniref:DUF4115 domain-containing protein n=1 Tax=Litorilituus sediminis TaxID=718192 RepID=A0A4P6P467_9GAMM|nr:RodZ domain-containing protein [Litorilituus sediminis]QBG35698.1 DUF4115 domain-containing protein [Litorilituus sediminis]